MIRSVMLTLLAAFAVSGSVPADDWYPSKFGADDTLGAINHLTPANVVEAAKLVKTGKTYALGVETGPESPAYPPRSYAMTILQLGDGTGTPLGVNKVTGNDDLMTTWMGIGSQIDGLGHLGIDHVYYNGCTCERFREEHRRHEIRHGDPAADRRARRAHRYGASSRQARARRRYRNQPQGHRGRRKSAGRRDPQRRRRAVPHGLAERRGVGSRTLHER